jgi:hypothetical protein
MMMDEVAFHCCSVAALLRICLTGSPMTRLFRLSPCGSLTNLAHYLWRIISGVLCRAWCPARFSFTAFTIASPVHEALQN